MAEEGTQEAERDDETQDSGSEQGKGEEAQKAQEKEEEREHARDKVKELEEGEPPADLEDWPDDAAKYETFGGPEGEHGYHEGPEEEKLGPSSLRHREDGSVSIAGDKVDDPDEYKGEPIPGGPTDPDAPQDLTTQKIRKDQGRELASEQNGESDSDDDSEDSDSGASEARASDDGDAESKRDDD